MVLDRIAKEKFRNIFFLFSPLTSFRFPPLVGVIWIGRWAGERMERITEATS